MSNWKTKFLLSAGKKVILKVVLQAIPTCTMFIFHIPKSISSKLNGLYKKLWWDFFDDSTKIQWLAWKQLGVAKQGEG